MPRSIPNHIVEFGSYRHVTAGRRFSEPTKSILQQIVNATNSLGDSSLNLGTRLSIVERGINDITTASMRSIKSLSYFLSEQQTVIEEMKNDLARIGRMQIKTQSGLETVDAGFKVQLGIMNETRVTYDIILGVLVGLCLLMWVLKWAHDACYSSVASFRKCSRKILPGCCHGLDSIK